MRFNYACSLLPALLIYSQVNAQAKFDDYNRDRINITKNGLTVLGSFAAANILVSGIASGNASGEATHFHRMNTMVSAVNLGLSGISIIVRKRKDYRNISTQGSFEEQSKGENLFLFNTGLDVAYIVGGFLLKEKSKSSVARDKYRGYGNAVLYQGSALLLFDGILYMLHQRHGKLLLKTLNNVAVHMAPPAIGVTMNL